jgi:outer membrane protein assembly factor BamD (BamD/ComL family)
LAYDRLRQYQRKFPAEASREGVPDMLVAVRERQASALYEIAARYRRSGKPLAAAFYAERLQERYPDSPWSVKAGEFLAGASMEPGPPDGRSGEQEPGK